MRDRMRGQKSPGWRWALRQIEFAAQPGESWGLVVGDASFQQRCLERMRQVLNAGTTLVFVSHDLAAVEATCANAMWLADGQVRAEGPVRDVLGEYRRSVEGIAVEQARDGILR